MPTGPWKELMSKDMLKPGSGWSVAGSPPWSMEGDSILNAVAEERQVNGTYLIWNEPLKDMEFEITYKLSTLGAGGGVQGDPRRGTIRPRRRECRDGAGADVCAG